VNEIARIFWVVVDWFDYWLRLTELRILDVVCGPLPETEETEEDRRRLEKADAPPEWPGHAR
jgi:hypothetical protein